MTNFLVVSLWLCQRQKPGSFKMAPALSPSQLFCPCPSSVPPVDPLTKEHLLRFSVIDLSVASPSNPHSILNVTCRRCPLCVLCFTFILSYSNPTTFSVAISICSLSLICLPHWSSQAGNAAVVYFPGWSLVSRVMSSIELVSIDCTKGQNDG